MHIHPEPSRSSLQFTPGTEVQLKQTCVENDVAWFYTIAIISGDIVLKEDSTVSICCLLTFIGCASVIQGVPSFWKFY